MKKNTSPGLSRFLIISILVSILVLFLISESLPKALFILVVIWSWYFFGKKYKNFTKISILYTFLLLPFNLTLQLAPLLQGVLTFPPYVSGLLVNYLNPVVSILDLFVFFLFMSSFDECKDLLVRRIKRPLFLILFLLFLAQNLYVQEITTVIVSIRILTYLLAASFVLEYLKEKKLLSKMLQRGYAKGPLLGAVFVQFFVGSYQFVTGASLGVWFLGESNISNGMINSSFIDINGESFLRAYGTFPHPNVLAGWLILVLLVTLLSFNVKRVVDYILLFFISFLMLLTFSRISTLLLILFLVLFAISKLVKRNTLHSFGGILLTRFVNVFNVDSSWSDRVKLFKVNLEIFKENALLGTGIGNSLRYYADRIPYTSNGRLLLQPVHNIFMLSLVEMGIFISIYFWFVIYRVFIKGTKWNLLKICILIFLIVVGMFDHYLLSLPQGLVILLSSLILLSY